MGQIQTPPTHRRKKTTSREGHPNTAEDKEGIPSQNKGNVSVPQHQERHLNPPPTLEPWLEFSNLKFESVQLEKRKDEYEKEELNRLANEKISSLGIDIRIYTDGSTKGQQRNGGAGV